MTAKKGLLLSEIVLGRELVEFSPHSKLYEASFQKKDPRSRDSLDGTENFPDRPTCLAKVSLITAESKRERNVVKKLSHPNILSVISTLKSEIQVYIVMEKGCGTLLDYVNKKGRLTERESALVMKNIVGAVLYLHSRKIVHRNIRLENLVLTSPENLSSVKLTEFGLSFQIRSNETGLTQETPKSDGAEETPSYEYYSPELLRGQSIGKETDLWAVGVCLYYLLTISFPFKFLSDSKLDRSSATLFEHTGLTAPVLKQSQPQMIPNSDPLMRKHKRASVSLAGFSVDIIFASGDLQGPGTEFQQNPSKNRKVSNDLSLDTPPLVLRSSSEHSLPRVSIKSSGSSSPTPARRDSETPSGSESKSLPPPMSSSPTNVTPSKPPSLLRSRTFHNSAAANRPEESQKFTLNPLWTLQFPSGNQLSPKVQDLLYSLLHPVLSERPTALAVLSSPWLLSMLPTKTNVEDCPSPPPNRASLSSLTSPLEEESTPVLRTPNSIPIRPQSSRPKPGNKNIRNSILAMIRNRKKDSP